MKDTHYYTSAVCSDVNRSWKELAFCSSGLINHKTNLFWSKSMCLLNTLIISHLNQRWEEHDSLKEIDIPKSFLSTLTRAVKGLRIFPAEVKNRDKNEDLLPWMIFAVSVGNPWRDRPIHTSVICHNYSSSLEWVYNNTTWCCIGWRKHIFTELCDTKFVKVYG